MQASQSIRYSMAFKQQVIEDVESGRFSSLGEAQRHYGIGGTSTIQKWLRKYGRNHLIPKVVRVEKPGEADEIRRLRRQIQELEKALGRTQLEKLLGDSFLRQACEALGEDVESFKKKAVTRPSTKSTKSGDRP